MNSGKKPVKTLCCDFLGTNNLLRQIKAFGLKVFFFLFSKFKILLTFAVLSRFSVVWFSPRGRPEVISIT